MKKLVSYLMLLTTFFFVSVSLSQPAPTDNPENLIKEGNLELKLKREQWIQEMHKTEPGINWKVLDEETRNSKRKIRKEKIEKLINNGISELSYLNDTVAADGIEGVWIERGSNNQAGRIMTVDFDTERRLLYAVSAGGNVWRGTLDGRDWTCLNNNFKFAGKLIRILKIGEIYRILVVSGKHVYYSDNEGLTWESASGFEDLQRWGSFRRGVVANDDKNTIFVLGNEWDYDAWKTVSSLYISVDKGKTFKNLGKFETKIAMMDIWAPRYESSEVYLMKRDTIFKVKDDEEFEIFTLFSGELPGESFDVFQSVMLKGSVVDGTSYLATALKTNEEPKQNFYLWDEESDFWDRRGTLNINPFNHNSFNISSYDPYFIYFGGVEYFRSYDGALVWEKQNKWGQYYGDPLNKLHADIPGIDIIRDNDGTEYTFISTDGGLYISDDQCYTVRNLSLYGLNVSQYYSVLTSTNNTDVIYAGSQDQGFQRCQTDSGATLGFTQTISGDYGHITTSNGGSTIWTVYPGFAMLYTDAEDTMKRKTWSFDAGNWFWMPYTVAAPHDPNIAYIAAGGYEKEVHLWKLYYDSQKITHLELPYDFNADDSKTKISSIEISKYNPFYFYLLTNNGDFYLSTDAGNDWVKNEDFTVMGGHYFYGSNIVPSSLEFGKVYIAGSGYSNPGAYVSYDHGQTFTPIDSGLPNTLIYDIALSADEKYLFAATATGPYVYIVEDNVWYDMSGLTAPDQTYWSVEYIAELETVRFATYGRGIWDFKFTDPSASSVSDFPNNKIEISAYPNPVTESSAIEFNMSDEAFGTVTIYDINGMIAAKLFEGRLSVGLNEFVWDGKSNEGFNLPNGSYMCVVSTGGFSSYVKLILEGK